MRKSNHKSSEYFVSLGFAEQPIKGDFDFENFPSKIGGSPIWLIPLGTEVPDITCNFCRKTMTFLMQLYAPIEGNKKCFHRMLYVFFCKTCWKKSNAVKVLRVQLPEKSDYYNGETLLNKDLLLKDEGIVKINSSLGVIKPEYFIDTCEESDKAKRQYINFYEDIEEKSSKKSSVYEDDSEDEEEVLSDPKMDQKVKEMFERYKAENPQLNENDKDYKMKKLEDECEDEIYGKLKLNDDEFFDLFNLVVSQDPKQIVRYCRDDFFPMWFSSKGMLTIKNTKCKHCKGDLIFECQVMPNIFNIYGEISDIDIGTIVIYTCRRSCEDGKNKFYEEYAYIQRTGDKLLEDIQPKKGKSGANKDTSNNTEIKPSDTTGMTNSMGKLSVGNEDDDGWVEVKSKKNKK